MDTETEAEIVQQLSESGWFLTDNLFIYYCFCLFRRVSCICYWFELFNSPLTLQRAAVFLRYLCSNQNGNIRYGIRLYDCICGCVIFFLSKQVVYRSTPCYYRLYFRSVIAWSPENGNRLFAQNIFGRSWSHPRWWDGTGWVTYVAILYFYNFVQFIYYCISYFEFIYHMNLYINDLVKEQHTFI